MKWIRYQYVCNVLNEGTENEEVILLNKKVGYNEANLIVAQNEAYKGLYEIVEDDEEIKIEPPTKVVWGSYEGWGTLVDNSGSTPIYSGVGEDSPCILEFDFEPKLLYIVDIEGGDSRQIFLTKFEGTSEEQTSAFVSNLNSWGTDEGIYICWKFEENKVKWYAYSPYDEDEDDPVIAKPAHQFNRAGHKYYYVAMG